MTEIKFFIPEHESIPTHLMLHCGDEYVTYERIDEGFRFYVSLDDEKSAMNLVTEIVEKIINEHDDLRHGVTWETVSLDVVPQEERYRVSTIIEWKYRIRDSY